MILAFLLALTRISIFEAKSYQKKALLNISRSFAVLPLRGKIYDRKGRILATNEISFSLWFLPSEFDFSSSNLRKIKKIFSPELFQKIIENKDQTRKVLLKENLDFSEVAKISSLNLEGFYLEKNFKRRYLEGEAFSLVLGYLRKPTKKELRKYFPSEWIGASGLEARFQDFLRGEPGRKILEKSKDGHWYEVLIRAPKEGRALYLTLDASLQKISFQALKEGLKKIGSSKGALILMDARNGEILSLVSLPSFDNNAFISNDKEKIKKILNDPDHPLFNRALLGQYPPASTIKPFLALAGLKENLIDENTWFDDRPGYLKIKNPYQPNKFSLFRDWAVHGQVNLKKALAVSCDIFFYILGGGYKEVKGLGKEKIIRYLKEFNFSKKTGIEIEEKPGFLPELDKNWYLGDTYNLSIGQGKLLVTPIQLLVAFTSIFNGGWILEPHLIKGKKIKIIKKINFKEKNLKLVQEGLREVVSKPYGTAHYLSRLEIPVAGKSGTAQVGKNKYLAWFVAVAPYPSPEISLIVLIEDAKWGELNTLPVVYQVLKQWNILAKKNIKN